MSDSPLEFERVALPGWLDGGFSLEIPPNSAVAVVGDEATGVDHLADFALGLERPTRGRILVHGEELATLPYREALLARRRVGYLPMGSGLLYNLSLFDNVGLPLRFGSDLRDDKIRGRVRVILGQMGVAAAADLRPSDATLEQQRRAALGRALAFDPDLVFLEHPFDGMTDRAAAELLQLARGGETDAGSRRTVFITGQSIPPMLRSRLEARYRLTRGRLEPEEG